MADLIDRQALIKAAEKKQFGIGDNTHPYEAIRIQGKYFREVVDNAPAVDAVEVVRCKDCKRWKYDAKRMAGLCKRHINYTAQYEFCSYGERREGDG